MKRELIVHQDPKSPISEVFRTLRTNIQFMNTKGKLKTILVTSTLPGEGKSWVSSNLAVTFAQAGNRVILIDADMRKGRQYTIFGAAPKPGLSNCLAEMEMTNQNDWDISRYIQKTEVENLLLIPAGSIPPNPSELLVSEQMMKLLNDLKEVCDLIIIDGTPCELVTDSLILTRLVDSTIIVTANKQTKKEDLKKVINNIQNVGGKISGIVLNKIPMSAKKYEQSYYYGSTSTRHTKTSKRTQTKRNEKPIYNRTSDLLKENSTVSKNKRVENGQKEEVDNRTKQETLNKEIIVNSKEEISIEKTNEILNEINKYLDEEKKKLN